MNQYSSWNRGRRQGAKPFIYIYIYIYIYICIYEGLRPLPPALPYSRGFDDRTIRWFDGLLTTSHLYPIGGSRACLLRSILAAGDGFGFHLGGLVDILGMGWVPDWPGDRQDGLDCTLARAWALFYQDPGIQVMAKVGGDLGLLGCTIN